MFKALFKFLAKCLGWFLLLSVIWVTLCKWVPVWYTPLMFIRNQEAGKEWYSLPQNHEWVPMEKISGNLQLAVVCSEDQNFVRHNGFDLKAIEKAFHENLDGKRIRGGSTISQQTAKNVFLWPGRSWLRKALEVYFTFLIEFIWGKERILEVYLNSVEMGDGIYGAQAGAQFWFHKDAEGLNKNEAAALAAILPSPLNYKANPPSNYIQSRIVWIKGQMKNYGTLNLVVNGEK